MFELVDIADDGVVAIPEELPEPAKAAALQSGPEPADIVSTVNAEMARCALFGSSPKAEITGVAP